MTTAGSTNGKAAGRQKLVDPDEVRRAMTLLLPEGQITEIRAFEAAANVSKYQEVYAGWFNSPEAIVKAVSTLTTASNVYFVPNSINPALMGRRVNKLLPAKKMPLTGDGDIVRRTKLLIDCDPVRPTGIPSTDEQHEQALDKCREIRDYLAAEGWNDPVFADSGNGAGLLYAIDLPADDGGLIERCLKALAAEFDDPDVKVDTSVHNASRLWRLYGVRNGKGDPDAEALGMPQRMSRILEVPESYFPVPRDLLEALAARHVEPERNGRQHQQHDQRHGASGDAFDVAAFIARHGFDVDGPDDFHGRQGLGCKWVFNQSPMCQHHDGAAHIEQHASGAWTAGCHHNSCSWTGRDLRQQFEPSRPESRNETPRSGGGGDTTPPKYDENEGCGSVTAVWREFPTFVFPRAVRDFIEIAGDALGCDSTFVAMPLLAGFTSAVGAARAIRLKRTWVEPAIIWTTVVAESGTLKTPAQQLALAPLHRKQQESYERYQVELAQHEQDRATFEKDYAEWKKSKAREGAPEKPTLPRMQQTIATDTTMEALVDILEANPRGVLLARDELSGWLRSFNQYRSKGQGGDVGHWLSIFNAAPLTVNRRTGKSVLYVNHPVVSVTGGIQPDLFRSCLGTEHFADGLAARFLVAMPPGTTKRWRDREVDSYTQSRLNMVFTYLHGLSGNVNEYGTMEPVTLPLTESGSTAFVKAFNEHAEIMADLSGDLRAAFSKLEGYIARLALLLHLVRCGAGDDVEDEHAVDAQSVEAGATLVRWFGNEVVRVYGAFTETPEQREDRENVELIVQRGGQITARELQRTRRKYRESVSLAEQALDRLKAAGFGDWQLETHDERGGRPVSVFCLHVGGDGTTTSKNTGDNEVVSPPPYETTPPRGYTETEL